MRINARWGSLAGIAALVLAAGCSGGSQIPSQSTPQMTATQPGGTHSTATTLSKAAQSTVSTTTNVKQPPPGQTVKHLQSWFKGAFTAAQSVFVADDLNNVIDVFDAKTYKQIAQLGQINTPQGINTDTSGNLYEADNGSQLVRIFAPPYNGTARLINDVGFYPTDVYADSTGKVWVANICSGFSGACFGGGNVSVWHGTYPDPRVLNGGPYRAYFVTKDASGNVWSDGEDSSFNPIIGYWAGGKGPFITVSIANFNFPGGIQFAKNGQLLLTDQCQIPLDSGCGGSILKVYNVGSWSAPAFTVPLQNDGDDVIKPAIGTANMLVFSPQYLGGFTQIVGYPGGTFGHQLVPSVFSLNVSAAVVPSTNPQ